MARRLRPCPRNRSISGATVARAFCHARTARSGGGWDVEGRITKLHPARPSFSQGGAGTLGNHLALVLGDGGEDVQGKPVGGRHVHGDEGGVANDVGIEFGAVPGGMRLSAQAARSIGCSAGLSASVGQPSTLRIVI